MTAYVEDITNGNMIQIKDENLWKAASLFADEKGLLNIMPPILKDKRFI
jgi:hypothetical protein